MTIYTYTEAQQKLQQILDLVVIEGEARIRRDDGIMFVIKQEPFKLVEESPFDVPGIYIGISIPEIVQFVQEGRRI